MTIPICGRRGSQLRCCSAAGLCSTLAAQAGHSACREDAWKVQCFLLQTKVEDPNRLIANRSTQACGRTDMCSCMAASKDQWGLACFADFVNILYVLACHCGQSLWSSWFSLLVLCHCAVLSKRSGCCGT